MKICTVCNENKPLDQFYNRKASEDGKAYRCKECDNKAVSNYRKLHIKRYRANQRKANMKTRYGISIEEFKSLKESQNNLCFICEEISTNRYHPDLVVDHDHSTGKIRGLLCHKCNQALGLLKDNINSLKRAIKYLQRN